VTEVASHEQFYYLDFFKVRIEVKISFGRLKPILGVQRRKNRPSTVNNTQTRLCNDDAAK
jgi:hypothetical protein